MKYAETAVFVSAYLYFTRHSMFLFSQNYRHNVRKTLTKHCNHSPKTIRNKNSRYLPEIISEQKNLCPSKKNFSPSKK